MFDSCLFFFPILEHRICFPSLFSLFFFPFSLFFVPFSPLLSHFHFAIIFFFYFKNFHTSENETQLIQLSIYLCIIQSSFRTVGRCSRRIDAIDQNKLFAVYGCSVDMCIACERWKIGCCCSATVWIWLVVCAESDIVCCVCDWVCMYSYSNHSIFRSHTLKAYYGAYILVAVVFSNWKLSVFLTSVRAHGCCSQSYRIVQNNKSIIASVYREHSYDIDVPNHIYHQIPFWKLNQARFSTSILFIAIERKRYRVKPKKKTSNRIIPNQSKRWADLG